MYEKVARAIRYTKAQGRLATLAQITARLKREREREREKEREREREREREPVS